MSETCLERYCEELIECVHGSEASLQFLVPKHNIINLVFFLKLDTIFYVATKMTSILQSILNYLKTSLQKKFFWLRIAGANKISIHIS